MTTERNGKKRITVDLPVDLHEKIQEHARQSARLAGIAEVSVSAAIRKLLRAGLEAAER